ncbi:MAG: UDP-2,4-diacetamido-2,4, 6-trideoxy-beta-L-altropyranose hydrolase, partial [Pseudomonadota bacterium]
HARCLLGPDYALLRPAFAAAHACARPRRWPPQRLLLFFGGADADNLSGRVLELLTRLHPELAIDALIGPSNPHRPALEARWQGHPGIRLLPPQDEPCPLLLEADLALGATGATTWERAATGLPAIVLALADNQLPIARAAADAGLHTFLGDARRLSDGELAERLGAALADHARLAAQSAAGLALVDGRGAERVADLLLAGLHP